jgi:chaperonin GroEL
MPGKTILYQNSARKVLERGMDILATAVSNTLGPKGRNVVLGKPFGTPQIVNDGVTIAKEIDLVDSLENTGVCLIRQAASKTNEIAGDGTTTATVLAYSLIKQGMRNVAAGSNPMAIKRGIENATQFAIDRLREYAQPVIEYEIIKDVATISAGNDKDAGALIADTFAKIGREGMIHLEDGKGMTNEVEIKEGMCFDKGFLSGYFVDDTKRMESVLEDAYILLTDKILSSPRSDLLSTLEIIAKTRKPLLIICDDVKNDALSTLIMNKIRGVVEVVAVKAPGYGDRRKLLLQDLAILTGGQVITSDTGYSLQNMNIEWLGQAQKVVVKKESTTIISDINTTEVAAKCKQLRRQVETSESTYEKEKILERLSKLSGIAIIRVGGATETEVEDRKLRLEDAINATTAAFEEGIVAGGGTVLAQISQEMLPWAKKNLKEDELIGAIIVSKALTSPLKTIATNAGQNGEVILERVKNANIGIGYDASTNTLAEMFTAGIIDPVRVTRSALQNAASISSIVLTTECLVVED